MKVTTVDKKIEKYYGAITCLVLCVYFFNNYADGLIKGGRWDLYQHIAMADRFLAGEGFYYSAIEASTPYFPGISFIAVIVGKLFYPWRDYILLALASLVGTLFLYALLHLAQKSVKNYWIPLIAGTYFLFTSFEVYRIYMNEFKADSLILLIGIMIIIIIDRMENDENKVNIWNLILLCALAFIMDVTKQQALYINIALGIYLLFAKKLTTRKKIKVLAAIFAAGILALIIIFSIPGLPIQAIVNLQEMPWWDIYSIYTHMKTCFLDHWLYVGFLVVFFGLCLKKKLLLSSLDIKWLLICLIVGIAQLFGGMKSGGNISNYEVGIVSFLPFVIRGIDYLVSEYIKSEKAINICIFSVTIVICCSMIAMLPTLYSKMQKTVETIDINNSLSDYISATLIDEEIMYSSNWYMIVARSSVSPGMDILSTPRNIPEYRDVLEEALASQKYGYLYIDRILFDRWDSNMMKYFNYKTHNVEYLDRYYEVIEDPDMPEDLNGKLYKAKNL